MGRVFSALVTGIGRGLLYNSGRESAEKWLNYRPERVAGRMNEEVRRAIVQGQPEFVQGAFEYLSDTIKNATSWDEQDDASKLLWLLKVVVVQAQEPN